MGQEAEFPGWYKTLPNTLAIPGIMSFSSLAGRNRYYSQPWMASQECVFVLFWGSSSPGFGWFLIHALANQHSAAYLGESPRGSLEFLRGRPLSGSLTWSSSCPSLPSLSAPTPRFAGSPLRPAAARPWPSAELGPLTVSRLSDVTVLTADVQCLGNYCFIYSVQFLVVSRRK